MGDSENPYFVRDLEQLLGEETSRLEKEKVLVELETGKMPQIPVTTANKQVERLGEEPKLSVISASMNLARFLEDTIRSVANQTFRGFEHTVIDGGSTDDTLAILKRYPHIKWISEKDSGYMEALRKGLALATEKYVMQCAWIPTRRRESLGLKPRWTSEKGLRGLSNGIKKAKLKARVIS